MTIRAEVVKDSVGPHGVRLTTVRARYPKFIHGELMTHRVFSRNASSSRAIPVERMIKDVERDIAHPVHWGRNQPGMQAREELADLDARTAHMYWNAAARSAVDHARRMNELGVHKQVVNRLIEPFAHINVLITATEWDNFFELRCHPDAQPEMRTLAEAIRDARDASTPRELEPGQWHLPFYDGSPTMADPTPLMVSAARCARVSYETHDGREPSVEEDVELYRRLTSAVPMHASPLEHQATPDPTWAWPGLHGNLVGWVQHRKVEENRRKG